MCFLCCFFNDTAATEIYTLSLHDTLPILRRRDDAEPDVRGGQLGPFRACRGGRGRVRPREGGVSASPRRLLGSLRSESRSEEHTSELQSRQYIVCSLLLETKNKDVSTSQT